MHTTAQLARHIREVHVGGNWTYSNVKDNLAGISWEKAVRKVHSFNSIAALVYHINYFVIAANDVLQGKPLVAHDKYSFEVPPIQSQEDWQQLVNKTLQDAALFAKLVEALPESQLEEDFWEQKYGSYYRNILGIIEHTHYHLGQIAILKKWLEEETI
jgi:hypothetical protein